MPNTPLLHPLLRCETKRYFLYTLCSQRWRGERKGCLAETPTLGALRASCISPAAAWTDVREAAAWLCSLRKGSQ